MLIERGGIMQNKKIDHLGIAVENLEKTIIFYEEILGLEKTGIETVTEQGVKIAFLTIGESKLELLEPLSEDSPVAKHIERGQGLHHLAIQVKDIEAKVEQMREKGIKFLGEKPTRGAEGMKIIFIHPKSTDGVLLELCAPAGEGENNDS